MFSNTSEWLQGEVARLTVQVTDVTRLPADPTSILLKIKAPSGVVTIKAAPDVVRLGLGLYECDLFLAEKGRYLWRWESAMPWQGASQGQLLVVPSNII